MAKVVQPKSAAYGTPNRYFSGEQPLTFISPELRTQLNNRLSRVSVNVPRLLVDSIAERLRIVGFNRADVWDTWTANDLDQTSGIVHREALVLGDAYAIVWPTPMAPRR